ncbi:type II toxin-antitoxin system HicB family antitoxin [Nostoc sp. CHAB 5844]|nr:type II toxin-antitoxin system HicB family antitoxin [Nostoc sp. CHAB 5844]
MLLKPYFNKEGGYWAEVPAFPGCITEGDTMEEVMANLKDAIEGWLDVANSRDVHDRSHSCTNPLIIRVM